MYNNAEKIVTRVLPEGLQWYSVQNQYLFPLYGSNGIPEFCKIGILVHHLSPGFENVNFGATGLHDGPEGKWYRIDFSATDSVLGCEAKLNTAIAALLS